VAVPPAAQRPLRDHIERVGITIYPAA